MTRFQRFVGGALVSADKMLQKGVKELVAEYDKVYKALARLVRSFYKTYGASDADAGVAAWGMASGEYARMMDGVERVFARESKELDRRLVHLLEAVLLLAYAKGAYANEWALGLNGVPVPDAVRPLPRSFVNLAVLGGNRGWERYSGSDARRLFGPPEWWMPKRAALSKELAAKRRAAIASILAALSAAVLAGSGLYGALRAVRRHVGSKFAKGVGKRRRVVLRGAAAETAKLARTEGNRLMNAGLLASGLALYGVGTEVLMKEWVAVLDSRTREQSRDMDGQVVAADGLFVYPNGATSMYPGMSGCPEYDVNDRCSCVTYLEADTGAWMGADPLTGAVSPFSWKSFDGWLAAGRLSVE